MKIVFAIGLALLVPLSGSMMTTAPIIWPISTLVYNLGLIGCFSLLHKGYIRLIAFNIVAASFFIVESAFFISYYIQDAGFNDAFFYHLRPDLLYSGVAEYLPVLAIFVIILLSFLFLASSAIPGVRANKNRMAISSVSLLFIGLFFSPSTQALLQHAENSSISQTGDDLFKDFPELKESHLAASFTGEKHPNIVMIYAEGIDQRYFDESIFPDLLPNLTKLKNQSIDYSNVSQGFGANWTMGGIFASQCGYPLTVANNMTGFQTGNQLALFDDFLPGATCIGDLLEQDGYYLSFMGGADARFGGKRNFLTTHGYEEVLDRDVLSRRLDDKSYLNSWGLFDDSLLSMAFEKFNSLSQSSSPFLLTLLTLDTHAPKGFLSHSCDVYGSGENSSLNSVHCSDQLISKFIEQIRESPYSDNTIIIVLSDHLTNRNQATSLLESSHLPKRLTFFVNVSDGRTEEIDSPGLHYDIAPTILDLAGYNIRGQMGFGTSLEQGKGYLPSRFGEDKWIDQKSYLIAIARAHWEDDVNINENGISFTVDDLGLTIGGKKFDLHSGGALDIPTSILFIFDEDTLGLEKIISHPLDQGLSSLDLSEKLLQFPGKLTLAISRAKNLPAFVDPRINPDQWVFYCGKPGSDYLSLGQINGDFYIPFKLIRDISQSQLDDRVLQARQRMLDNLARNSGAKQGT